MTKNFLIEVDVEQVAIDWLKNLGYVHMAGADIRHNFKKRGTGRQAQKLPSETISSPTGRSYW